MQDSITTNMNSVLRYMKHIASFRNTCLMKHILLIHRPLDKH